MTYGTATATILCDIYDKTRGELIFTDRLVKTYVECTSDGEITDFKWKQGEIMPMNNYLYAVCLDDMSADKEVEDYDNGSNLFTDFLLLVKSEEINWDDYEIEPDDGIDHDAYDRMNER